MTGSSLTNRSTRQQGVNDGCSRGLLDGIRKSCGYASLINRPAGKQTLRSMQLGLFCEREPQVVVRVTRTIKAALR